MEGRFRHISHMETLLRHSVTRALGGWPPSVER